MKKKLLFIGLNHNQVPYLRSINRNEWMVIGVDLNSNAPGKDLCDRFYNVGYDDLKALVNVGKNERFSACDMVFTAAAQFAQKGAAHFAEEFGISYPSENSVDLCLDKKKYYDYFSKNDIPIPKTWSIESESDLEETIHSIEPGWLYLKSDFSKNPNYVYRFSSSAVPWGDIFWGKDRYLQNYYLLQKEYDGVSLRINVYGGRFNVFDFQAGEKTSMYHDRLMSLGVLGVLVDFISTLKMKNWLVKFDVILGSAGYVVLDIGMDPPSRMLKESKASDVAFAKHYVDQYLYGRVDYPEALD